jgi:putative phosphoribosyl transferase
MTFQNRSEAGHKLAALLTRYANRGDVIVLGIPRGGVTVAFEVAAALHAPLDVFVIRKLGVPWQEELAFGAIAGGGIRILDPEIIEAAGVSPLDVEEVAKKELRELERREHAYRAGRPPLAVEGQTVIVVDDGVATGSSMRAAIAALREKNPGRLVVAIPVAPPSTCERLSLAVDELVCVTRPESLYAIGQFYLDFRPVTDEEVTELLRRAASPANQGAAAKS